MEKYQRGKIYAIICRDTGKKYIGSTYEPTLAKRLAKHNNNFKDWIKGKRSYVTSYDILQENNYHIVLIESYPCNSKDELRMREQYHIDLNNCVNKQKAILTNEQRLEREQKYRDEHKEQIAEYNKKYKKECKEKIIEHAEKYRNKHKNKLSEKGKIYYELNKEKINEKARERVCCSNCQKEMCRSSLTRHTNMCSI